MKLEAEQIAEEFDRDYLEPANARLRKEHERLYAMRRELESIVQRKRTLAERMQATIREIETEREAISAALTHYQSELQALDTSAAQM